MEMDPWFGATNKIFRHGVHLSSLLFFFLQTFLRFILYPYIQVPYLLFELYLWVADKLVSKACNNVCLTSA